MPRTKTSSTIEMLVALDRAAAEPLHRQLEQELRVAIRSGRLMPSAALPSSRAFAAQLGVSRGIVVEAYEQLIAEGYLAARPGGATHVAQAAAPVASHRSRPPTPRPEIDFRPGRPDLDEFPRAAWLRSMRRVLTDAPSDRLGYLDGRGVPELRNALADYLNRVRGTCAEPDDLVVTTGFVQGLALLAKVLHVAGARRVAMEDPSQVEAREAIRAAGLEVVGVPVDDDGIRLDALDATDADAVLVTAAHQYPTGAVLPPDRRAGLVAWATRRAAVVIEDDYDAEFRYDREPIGAIQGLDPARVVYAGSASKVLAPGLRLGWLIAPPELGERIARAKRAADHGSAALDQLAFADYLARGELDRHLRRLRPIYRRRRDALIDALRRHLPDFHPVGASAGLHVLVWLPPGLDDVAAADAARAAGIAIDPVAPQRLEPSDRGGLIFGYGSITEAAIEPAVQRLSEVLSSGRAVGSRSASAAI
jgi:GntR family transcriptional regulator/MocR family aminotransferase